MGVQRAGLNSALFRYLCEISHRRIPKSMIEKQIFPRVEIVPLRRIGRAVIGFFNMHQLSTHSDHFEGNGGAQMLDRELYDKQEQRMRAYWEPYCIPEGEVIQSPNPPDAAA